jgi:hypothetical protein
MSQKRKGQLTASPEWVKHLRKYLKRHFWKRERLAVKKEVKIHQDDK